MPSDLAERFAEGSRSRGDRRARPAKRLASQLQYPSPTGPAKLARSSEGARRTLHESLRSNEIAELRHRDASRREGRPIDGVNAAIHGLGTGSVQAVLEGLRLATMAALRLC
jgi:hypothetical protein